MNLIPGIVRSYDPQARTCRVEIPGMTDGAEQLPEAEINQAPGDKSEHTEIRIIPGDRVWLAFINGDPRFPVIMGFRAKQTGNEVGTRRWHHENIETDADATQKHTAGESFTIQVGDTTILVEPDKVTITTPQLLVDAPQSVFTGAVTVQGLLTYQAGMSGSGGSGATASIQGNIVVTSGNVTADSISLKGHGHIEQGDGNRTSNAVT